MSASSDPQSVFRRMGQTPCSLTARKYKAAGTNGIRKPIGFFMFSGGIEKQHQAVMG